jgi:hypothetical protein
MRFKDAFITGTALVLSLSTLTGLAYTEQFQQAARVEVGGFDALAHDLFNSSQLAGGETDHAMDGRMPHIGGDQLAVSKQ